jgi:hypothetical protein
MWPVADVKVDIREDDPEVKKTSFIGACSDRDGE